MLKRRRFLLFLALAFSIASSLALSDQTRPSSTKLLNKVYAVDATENVPISPEKPPFNAITAVDFPEQRLAQDLLANYTPWARPCRNCSEPIAVSLEFSLMQINGLDEKTQVLTTTGWLTVKWRDEKLRWQPADYGNLTTLEVPANLVWVPIFGLDNHARSLYDSTFRTDFFIRADFNGDVHWDVGNQFISSCSLALFYYPWDRQACILSFQSYSHTARKMRLYADKPSVNLEDFTPHGEWNISNTLACHQLSLYNVSSPDGFWSVHFEIQLNRKPKFYITHMIIPCVVLAFLVFIVFWLPPEAGEKVSLAMTILLSFSVFLLMIAENMPKTSDSVPLVAIYLASFMAASAISIVLSVWVIRSYYHDLNCSSRSTGQLCRRFIRRFAFLVDVDDKTVEAILQANKNHRCDMTPTADVTANAHNFSSRALSASNEHADLGLPTPGDDSPLLANTCILATIAAANETTDLTTSDTQLRNINKMTNDVRQISRSVNTIRRYYEHGVRKKAHDESCINEWRLFARVTDRVMLFLHVILFFASFVYVGFVFASAPDHATTGKCSPMSS